MKRNIYLEVEYRGTNYFGFQIQNRSKQQNTIQAEIESALLSLLRESIRISYSGRTDRGVHAKAQGVSFKTDSLIELPKIKSGLNAFLPEDIRVKKVKAVGLGFHARFSAKSKIYRYIILNRKQPSVFWKDFSWHIPDSLDIGDMRNAAALIAGRRDFSVFTRNPEVYHSCVREVKYILARKRSGFVYIDIGADGFLRNMARNIAAFLVKVGKGEVALDNAADILERKFSYSNHPAPPQGLYLMKVRYS